MHDFAPQQQNATCLSFRAGQVIRVLNRDTSGWWDGELEGRRGWFPSNYVNAEVDIRASLVDEESLRKPVRLGKLLTDWRLTNGTQRRRHHRHTSSIVSIHSWAGTPSPTQDSFTRTDYRSVDDLGPDVDAYCPPLMVPLLHGLQLLQNAVRANRLSHFQPSTACIISCVRSVLSATDCLPREAPLLSRYPLLSQERKRILSVLASLVAQAKKASDESNEVNDRRDSEVEAMLRVGGQVFAHVRRFLVVAVQCGIELPQQRQSVGSGYGSTDTEGLTKSQEESSLSSANPYGPIQVHSASVIDHRTALQEQHPENTARPNSASRAKSMGDLRHQRRMDSIDSSDAMPLLPHRTVISKAKEEKYQRMGHKPAMFSVSSTTSSSSSLSSVDSVGTPATPPFPSGPSTTTQVMEALRHTHDNYLSTIAAFIGHAHSHSRSSHASSTGHMYDLVREVVEMVCKLLTIVEAVMQHPDVPPQKLGSLKSAKEGLYSVTSTLAESVRLLTLNLPTTISEEEEKSSLLRSATRALKAGADCVAAVKMCLNRSSGERSFVIQLPAAGEPGHELISPSNFVESPLWTSGNLAGTYGYIREEDEDITLQVQGRVPSPVQTVRKDRNLSFDGSDESNGSKESLRRSDSTRETSPESHSQIPYAQQDSQKASSPTASFARTDDDPMSWEEGSQRHQRRVSRLEEKIINGHLPSVPHELEPEFVRLSSNSNPLAFIPTHDYALDEVAFNNEGHLVGATLRVLVEKMTPHDSIVDPAFASVFFLTFRLFTTPPELVDALKARYDLPGPINISPTDRQTWEQMKGTPVRLRVTNFVKMWLEMYWRPASDGAVLEFLMSFTKETVAATFAAPAQRILELIRMRMNKTDSVISPKGDRIRDPGMSINPPSAPSSEIPRPSMTKTLLAALRSKTFSSISITDFDPLELARQLTIMECDLYCAIQPEEVLETGQEGAKPPVNVRAVSSLSTVITGWVAESILDEPDIKKRVALIKFFIKVADVSCHSISVIR
jgi:son of sevenless-like protein